MRARNALSASAVLTLVMALGCGTGRITTQSGQEIVRPIAVTISPSSVSLSASATLQFTATVSNTSNYAVSWSVKCGAADCGTISPTGLYTAPALFPNQLNITITAVPQADPTKSSSAVVTAVVISVFISPPWAMTMAAGETRTFTASLLNHSNQNVTWSLSGEGCAGEACGTLTNVAGQSATYVAPAAITTPATAMITATSTADTTKSESVAMNLMPKSPAFGGRYAMLFRTSDSSTLFAASLVADGNGNLSGVGDLVSASGVHRNEAFTGTYTLGSDRHGTMEITVAGVTLKLRMVVVTGDFGRLLDFSGVTQGNGWFEKQNETAFGTAAMRGGNFVLGGTNANAFTSRVGYADWNASGHGGSGAYFHYAFFADCTIDGGTGRGVITASAESQSDEKPQMAFYVVDATRAIVIGDIGGSSLHVSGSMNAPTDIELSGDYTYYLVSATSLAGGRFTATTGASGYSATISGSQDEISDAGVKLDLPLVGGLTEGGFGEPVLTLSVGGKSLSSEIVLTNSRGVVSFVTEDGSYGEAYLQSSVPFSADDFAGNYSVQLFGRDTHALGNALLEASTITGLVDISHGTVMPGLGLEGTVSSSTADRADVSLWTAGTGTLPFRAYAISPKRVLLISLATGEVTMGWAEKIE